MKSARLGKSGAKISRVGIGAWQASGSGPWGSGPHSDDRMAIAAIRRAVDGGVTWVDTAASYGLGHSEEIVRRALAPWKVGEEVVFFTKCALLGILRTGSGPTSVPYPSGVSARGAYGVSASSEPLLLIVDEPTASLDAYTEHAVFGYARASQRAGRGVGGVTVLISHRFSTVRMADSVVVLEAGRLVQVGTHEELSQEEGPYRELYELQSRAYR